MGKEKTLSWYT